jgi:glycosyltransferase involved in cell wall biosynthesis
VVPGGRIQYNHTVPLHRIGLIGPDQSQPCGIADYTARLAKALASRCDLSFSSFREAERVDWGACRAVLVQYERSLVPDPDYLRRLQRRHRRIFVVPHEIYVSDPFAFPYAKLSASHAWLLWLKRLRYRWRHRHYGREQALQAMGYHAWRVIPGTPEGEAILKSRALPEVAESILPPIPLACPDASEFAGFSPADRARWFSRPPRVLVGIFGFVNPGHDYGAALDLMESLGPEAGLLMGGGPRGPGGGGGCAEEKLDGEIARRGLQGNVRVTGYVPPKELEGNLRLCDMFLCPFKFKSNSASILRLFHLGKPILAADLPLTRFLAEQGAPIDLYSGPEEMRARAAELLSGGRGRAQGTYRWSFAAVAGAYLEAMLAGD